MRKTPHRAEERQCLGREGPWLVELRRPNDQKPPSKRSALIASDNTSVRAFHRWTMESEAELGMEVSHGAGDQLYQRRGLSKSPERWGAGDTPTGLGSRRRRTPPDSGHGTAAGLSYGGAAALTPASEARNFHLPNWLFEIDEGEDLETAKPLLEELDMNIADIALKVNWVLFWTWIPAAFLPERSLALSSAAPRHARSSSRWVRLSSAHVSLPLTLGVSASCLPLPPYLPPLPCSS